MIRSKNDDVLTDAGWPRPRNADGYPVPWISNPEDMGVMDRRRHRESVRKVLCQVCGEEHDEGSTAYLFVRDEVPDNASDLVAAAMDDGILHGRCARLAYARCPEILRLRAAGQITVYSFEVKYVEQISPHLLAKNLLGVPLENLLEEDWG